MNISTEHAGIKNFESSDNFWVSKMNVEKFSLNNNEGKGAEFNDLCFDKLIFPLAQYFEKLYNSKKYFNCFSHVFGISGYYAPFYCVSLQRKLDSNTGYRDRYVINPSGVFFVKI